MFLPVIAVKENKNRMKNDLEKLPFGLGKLFIVENYIEAAGLVTCLKAGVSPSAVRRPLGYTKVSCERVEAGDEQEKMPAESGNDGRGADVALWERRV